MEVVGKVMIDGILEVIEAIMANSTTMEIAIGREVHLAERTVINLHFGEAVQTENLFRMILLTKMPLLQVCISLKTHYQPPRITILFFNKKS